MSKVYAMFGFCCKPCSIDHEGSTGSPLEAEPLERAEAEAAVGRLAADTNFEVTDVRYEPAEPESVPPEALEGPTAPAVQIETARLLALAHSHQWATALSVDEGSERLRAARREYARRRNVFGVAAPLALIAEASDALGYGACGGIGAPHLATDGDIVHETQSGRLRWRVRPDGSATLEVYRPHPTVAALRPLDDETAEHALERGRLLEMLTPAAELIEGRELTEYEVARWYEERLSPVLVLRAQVEGPAGDYRVEAPAGLDVVGVRHVQALEGALRALECWAESPDVRALYEGCADYGAWRDERVVIHREFIASGQQPWGGYEWPWAAGPCPQSAAA